MRSALRMAHRWSGLALAPMLLLQAVTGLLWSNQEALTPIFHPEARVVARSERAPLDNLLSAIASRYPDGKLDRIAFPTDDRLALTARVVTETGGLDIVLVDPSTARILSSGPVWTYPEQMAERMHGSLLLGRPGHWILLCEGMLVVLMVAAGLGLWWPGRERLAGAFVLHISAPRRRLLRDLHLVPGALAASFLIVTGLSGALLAVEPLTAALVSWLAPVAAEVEPFLPAAPAGPMAVTAERAIAALQARFPTGRLAKARVTGPGDRMLVAVFVDARSHNPSTYDMAGLDRRTGAMTVFVDAARRPAGDAALAWLAPIHAGEVYGPLRSAVATTIGTALILMVLTGVANWIAHPRRQARRKPRP
jgi:uncharacterized iron-regulated membrane protein